MNKAAGKKARISFLDMNENLLKIAEGVATNGSINIDGASAVRRTCQLNFISTQLKAVDYFQVYKTKFLLEIDMGSGYKKQGVYLLTSFSSNISANNFTFNISGKDKMCLLNGENGGSFPFSIDVGNMEKIDYNYERLTTFEYEPGKYYIQTFSEEDSSEVTGYELDYSPYATADQIYFKQVASLQTIPLTIKEIINNILTVYGKEYAHNIFIYDLDIQGLELLEYRGSEPLYLYRNKNTGKVNKIDLVNPFDDPSDFYPLSPLPDYNPEGMAKEIDGCYVIQVQYGDTLGYRDTDLIYAGNLTANINENVVSILDKIKNMLGNYEYFYNEEGHFVFQKRKDYTGNQFDTISIDGLGMEYQSTPLKIDSPFELNEIVSIGQNPQFQNIKNDFSIWGTRSGSSGNLPIHSRVAIHRKPMEYCSYFNILWKVNDKNENSLLATKCDLEQNIYIETQQTMDNMKKMYDDSTFQELKNKYLSFYPNFISHLSTSSNDNNLRSFYASLHWIWTVCEIIDYIGFGRNIILESEGWPLTADYFIKRIFQKMLVATHSSNSFGETIMTLAEEEAKKMYGDGDISFSNNITREELVLGINEFDAQYIYCPSYSVEEGEKTYKLYFLTESVGRNELVGHRPIKGLNPIETFEIESVYEFLTQSILKNITQSNYSNIKEVCEEQSFNKLGLLIKEDSSNNVKWISMENEYLFLTYPSFSEIGQRPRAQSLSVQQYFIIANKGIANSCAEKKAEYNDIHTINRIPGSTIYVSDWREILYQMAKDYYDNGTKLDFWQKINQYNDNQYLNWKTGYEAFYEDILGFWRQLYFDPLYESLNYELPPGYTLDNYFWGEGDSRNGWHKDVFQNPSGLNFWIDFIEPQGELSAYSIDSIGVKGKYENNSQVKSIATKKTPPIKVLTELEWQLLPPNPDPSYTYILMGGILSNAYTISSQGISALEKTQNHLFNHTYLQESINFSIIPREDLKVNSRVKLNMINIKGDYTISKITMPLAYNGMMSITLTKIPPTLTTEIIIKEFE